MTRQLTNQNQTTNLKPATTNQFSATIKPNSIAIPNKTRSNLTHGNPKPDHFFNSFFTDKPKPTTKPYQFFSLETHNQTHSTQQSNPRQPTHPRRKPIKPQGSQITDTDHQTPPKSILNGAGKKNSSSWRWGLWMSYWVSDGAKLRERGARVMKREIWFDDQQ